MAVLLEIGWFVIAVYFAALGVRWVARNFPLPTRDTVRSVWSRGDELEVLDDDQGEEVEPCEQR